MDIGKKGLTVLIKEESSSGKSTSRGRLNRTEFGRGQEWDPIHNKGHSAWGSVSFIIITKIFYLLPSATL